MVGEGVGMGLLISADVVCGLRVARYCFLWWCGVRTSSTRDDRLYTPKAMAALGLCAGVVDAFEVSVPW